MAAGAGQKQQPPELLLVRDVLKGAGAQALLDYADRLDAGAHAAPAGGPWVNKALQPLIGPQPLSEAWTAAQDHAAGWWFGDGGRAVQWVDSLGSGYTYPWPDLEQQMSTVLAKIARQRAHDITTPFELFIACRKQNTIGLDPITSPGIYTITVPYTIFTLAQIDPVSTGHHLITSNPGMTDVDLATVVRSPDGNTVAAARERPAGHRVRWNPQDPTAILDDIQGNLLSGHGRDAVHLFFLTFDNNLRSWLKRIGPKLTSALDQAAQAAMVRNDASVITDPFVGLYLSHAALTDLDPVVFDDEPDPLFFSGDPTATPLDRLAPGERLNNPAYALLLVAADTPTRAEKTGRTLIGTSSHIHVVHDSGQRRPDSAEPFGFRDGIADPAMTLTGALRQMDAGVSRTNPPVFPVEQVLTPITVTVNGEDRPSAASYLAYIKFDQDIQAFYSASTADERAARIGRWTDGTPYGTTGHGPLNDNDYDFQAPPYDRCPASAHIRAVNPRDSHGQGRAWTIARRGVPYETPKSSGLHFMAFMSSIVHQYDKMLEHAMAANDALLTGDHQGHRYVTPLTCGYYLALPKSYFASL